jgi:hypothetical protein
MGWSRFVSAFALMRSIGVGAPQIRVSGREMIMTGDQWIGDPSAYPYEGIDDTIV